MLEQGLRALPVVVVTGARQTGKSTLVRSLSPGRDRLYVTLDDLDVQEQAQKAPEDLVRRANRMTLDEVQRSPDLLRTIKRVVDQDREAGRFILTGSANLLMMRQVSESLAGRAVYLNLWPLTRREQLGLGQTGIWSVLLETPCSGWPDLVANTDAPEESWRERVLRGGFPTPSHEMHDARDRALWFDGYIRTYLERDLLELSAIDQLADFRRLMRAAGLRVGSLLNQAEIARDVTLPPSTAQRYLNLLEISYQMVRLPAYAVNRTKRLTKSPKVYWSDTALALHLAGEVEPRGAHLENLVFGDLLAWQSGRVPRPEILYWRTSKGAEVDFVIESGNRLLPIEVKSSRQVRYSDVNHLKVFMHEYADLVSGGLLLYDGTESYWVAERILAVPWWKVI
jgi:predicted AAA+ superfamily ATPase